MTKYVSICPAKSKYFDPVPTQSLSKMMTVSAEVRLMPRPPALVLSRNKKTSGSEANLVIWGGQTKSCYAQNDENCAEVHVIFPSYAPC